MDKKTVPCYFNYKYIMKRNAETMAEYLAPGVYMEEFDSGVKAMEGVGTSTAGFLGLAEKGPVMGHPVLLTSFAEYQRRFGGYLSELEYGSYRFLPNAVEQFFTNGGSTCYVMRVAPEDAAIAQSAEGPIRVTARDPGAWANTMQAILTRCVRARTQVLAAEGDGRYQLKDAAGFRAGDILACRSGDTVSYHKITALAGIGICAPALTAVTAFAYMVGIGGAALMSISLGQQNADRARQALGNAFWLLVGMGTAVTAVLLPLHKPLLYLLGCSDALYPYTGPYFTVYILGTLASLLGVGLNQFLLAQGFARQGMIAVVLGALINVVLDPLFLFGLRLGVVGAAAATVLSQCVMAVYVVVQLCRPGMPVPLRLHRPGPPSAGASWPSGRCPSSSRCWTTSSSFCSTSCCGSTAATGATP